jgi:hypothetical protein
LFDKNTFIIRLKGRRDLTNKQTFRRREGRNKENELQVWRRDGRNPTNKQTFRRRDGRNKENELQFRRRDGRDPRGKLKFWRKNGRDPTNKRLIMCWFTLFIDYDRGCTG